MFQGIDINNNSQYCSIKHVHYSTYGEGVGLIGENDTPTILLWVHMDGIFVHDHAINNNTIALDYKLKCGCLSGANISRIKVLASISIIGRVM